MCVRRKVEALDGGCPKPKERQYGRRQHVCTHPRRFMDFRSRQFRARAATPTSSMPAFKARFSTRSCLHRVSPRAPAFVTCDRGGRGGVSEQDGGSPMHQCTQATSSRILPGDMRIGQESGWPGSPCRASAGPGPGSSRSCSPSTSAIACSPCPPWHPAHPRSSCPHREQATRSINH
jgi:hypothetical protein